MITPVTVHRAEKYAFDMSALSPSGRDHCMRNFGHCRKIYNLYVSYYYDALEAADYTGGDNIPSVDIPEVSEFKKQYPYLKEADALGLANVKIDAQGAIRRFEKQSDHTKYTNRAIRRDKSGTEPLSFRGLRGVPKFHSKHHGYNSYTTNCQYSSNAKPTIRLEGDMLYIPKYHDGFRLVIHRKLPKDAVIKNVTISMDTDGRIYASIGYTYTVMMDMSIREAVLAGDESIVDRLSFLGLDYSQKDLYVDSEGRKANYPHYYRSSEEKLAGLQHKLSKMERGSHHYLDTLAKIQRTHVKIRNQRVDFLRKLALTLSQEYDVIAVEDIDLRAMGSCLHLGKNLHDNGFGMLRVFLSQKLNAKGSVLVKVDKMYPSTKTCHHCGSKNNDIQLSDREWTCPVCGTHHDRDINAALNIRDKGKRIFVDFYAAYIEEEARAKARAEKLSDARKHKKVKQAS